MVDGTTRQFVVALLADNGRLERQAHLALALARMMQELGDLGGCSFGLPAVSPETAPAELERCAAVLATRLQPPAPPAGDGTRIPVGNGAAD